MHPSDLIKPSVIQVDPQLQNLSYVVAHMNGYMPEDSSSLEVAAWRLWGMRETGKSLVEPWLRLQSHDPALSQWTYASYRHSEPGCVMEGMAFYPTKVISSDAISHLRPGPADFVV